MGKHWSNFKSKAGRSWRFIKYWTGRYWYPLCRSCGFSAPITLRRIFFGFIDFLCGFYIVGLPFYLSLTEAFKGSDLFKWLIWAALLAYLFQHLYKAGTAKVAQVNLLEQKHNRSLTAREAIRDIDSNIREKKELKSNRRLIESVLEAMKDKVSELLGGYMIGLRLEVNLMIQSPNDRDSFKVIARHGNTRPVPVEYKKNERFCNKAWETKEPVTVGDVYYICPDRTDLPYRDIMSFPLLDLDESVIACINFDSKEPHHFPKSIVKLRHIEIELSPYMSIIRLVLKN